MEENKDNNRNEIFSERVRAGKRTYFFDIKATRANDYYLTITESKRRYKEDGFVYEKHKIFLYKEDFEKFANALNNSIDHVKTELLPGVDFSEFKHKEYSSGDGAKVEAEAKVETETNVEAGTEAETNVESEPKTGIESESETGETGESDLKWE